MSRRAQAIWITAVIGSGLSVATGIALASGLGIGAVDDFTRDQPRSPTSLGGREV